MVLFGSKGRPINMNDCILGNIVYIYVIDGAVKVVVHHYLLHAAQADCYDSSLARPGC